MGSGKNAAENKPKSIDFNGGSGIIKVRNTDIQNDLLGGKENLWSKIKSKLASSSGAKITKADAEAALLDIGFERVDKSFYSKVDPKLQVAVIEQLTKLESRFNVLKKSVSPYITADAVGDSIAFARYDMNQPAIQSLHLSKTKFKNAKTHIRERKSELAKNHCMPCEIDNDTLSKYVVTHEYGHMLSSVLAHERMQGTIWTRQQLINSYKNQIIDIAKRIDNNFTIEKYLSNYGFKNDDEFFAECFANSQLGNPNVLGTAMEIWLKKEGY